MNNKICVNINELVKALQCQKCDYYVDNDNKKHYGHHLSFVLDMVLQHTERSSQGWVTKDINRILEKIRQKLEIK